MKTPQQGRDTAQVITIPLSSGVSGEMLISLITMEIHCVISSCDRKE